MVTTARPVRASLGWPIHHLSIEAIPVAPRDTGSLPLKPTGVGHGWLYMGLTVPHTVQSKSMELPVAPASYQPTPDALLRAAKRVDVILARTIATETPLDAATAFISGDYPLVPMANFATDLTLDINQAQRPGHDPESLLSQLEVHFETNSARCVTLDSADPTWPPPVAQAIEHRGYRPIKRHLYQLKHAAASPRLPSLQILPARSMYKPLLDWYRPLMASLYGRDADPEAVRQQAQAWIDLLDEPRYELFLGRVNGLCVATAGVVTLGQIGVLHGLHVHIAEQEIDQGLDGPINPDAIAKAMLGHVFDHCARAQFDTVIVESGDDAKPHDAAWWASWGFESVASFIRYTRPG